MSEQSDGRPEWVNLHDHSTSEVCRPDCSQYAALQREKAASGTYQQNPDGSWSPAEPIGWLEEHGIVARFIFWLRGIGHCGKPGRGVR